MMSIGDFLGLFFTLGLGMMGLSGWVVYRVWAEVNRNRRVALQVEERLAAYRHAVEVAAGREA